MKIKTKEKMAKLMAEKASVAWRSGFEDEAAECLAAALYYKLAAQHLQITPQ